MTVHTVLSRINHPLIVGFSILLCLCILILAIPGAYFWLPANVHYHVIEKHHISILKGQAGVKIGIVIPKSGPYQTVRDPVIQWEGEQEWVSNPYLDAIKLWGEIDDEHPQHVFLAYDLIIPQGTAAWKSPVEQKFTIPQESIESDHPAIINQSEALSNDPYQIYKFTSRHLVFSEENCGDTGTSALEAYSLKAGTCLGYARLMVALCRSAGVPARVIIGTTLPDNFYPVSSREPASTPISGHAWLEYYSQGNWHLADPSWGQGFFSLLEFNRNDGLHLSFGEHDDFYQARKDLFSWATRQSFINLEELTYIITSDVDSVAVSTEFEMNKKWDGRWLNTFLVFGISTFMLRKIRDKLFPREKA